jgi:hypothetical protein
MTNNSIVLKKDKKKYFLLSGITEEQYKLLNSIIKVTDNLIYTYGHIKNFTDNFLEEFTIKIKLHLPKRLEFLSKSVEGTKKQYEEETEFYFCYQDESFNRPSMTLTETIAPKHQTALSSFNCAREKIGNPTYIALIIIPINDTERVKDDTIIFDIDTYIQELTINV